MNKKAFINGIIFTANDNQPYAEAVITEGKNILFTGSNKEADAIVDDYTEVFDLKKRLMLPGLIDNHTHFIYGGFYLKGLDLRPANSVGDFIYLLKSYIEKNSGKWVTGGNWNHESWDIKLLPTRKLIDNFSTETPVFINRIDGHIGLANSLALKLAGISRDSDDPAGGIIDKDSNGEPTGILKDSAINLVTSVIPPPSEQEYYAAALASLDEAKKFGITSIQDITLKNDFIAYQQLLKNDALSCRIYTRFPIQDYTNLVNAGIKYNFGNDKLKIGSLKAFSDGSLGANTAWFFDPYNDSPDNYGLPMDVVSNGSLHRMAIDADRYKLQLSIHAIGDKANSYLLDLLEDITDRNVAWDRRFRIEHAQHVRKPDLKRISDLKAIVSAQPFHLNDDGNWAEKKIGYNRVQESFSFKSMLNSGIKLCFGSDFPVVSLNPLLGIYSAVTRRTSDGKNYDGWVSNEKISVEDAVKCYTINNAYAAFEENIKGSIEPGKLADMVVLDENILSVDQEKIKDANVIMTILNGEIIYRNNNY